MSVLRRPTSKMRGVRGAVVGVLAYVLVVAGTPAAADEGSRLGRVPDEDPSQPIAMRIAAIGKVLMPLGDAMARISADWSESNPGPPDAGSDLALALEAALDQADALARAAAAFCSGEDVGVNPGPPDIGVNHSPPSLDGTPGPPDIGANPGPPNVGLAGQAIAVAIVLAEATGRLGVVSTDRLEAAPGPPDEPEQRELARVYDGAVAIAFTAAEMLGLTYHPPNPICER